MTFLYHHSGKYYYIGEWIKTSKGLVRKNIRDATEEEIAFYLARKAEKDKGMARVTCPYPYCDNQFMITRSQKRNFYATNVVRYRKLQLPCCSTKCQKKYKKLLDNINPDH